MISFKHWSHGAITVATCVLAAGCGSSPDYRYFTLNAATEESRSKLAESLSITVGPVSLADHLGRRAIVSRGSDGEVLVSNSERWAGGLAQNIADTLAASLSNSTGSTDVISYYANFHAKTEYSIDLHISEFELVSAEVVRLSANWRITVNVDNTSQLHARAFEVPVGSMSIEDRIVAKNQALSLLSEAVHASIIQ